ncbi:MAG: LLM class F420-dependent oxidoreductase [Ferrimicrobium sp.]|uniref:LLM class F420-dependent oxidoreductase n=1 Tax=Ferrimicrobium acidiphilum TaxID=121039 RepID=A0ABV3XYG4_9ACTN|nr:LLM class F420-dependent oxidoreductase [Ferrimicrobium sp.]
MNLAMQINYAGDILATVEEVCAYEAAGLDLVLVAEAYGFDAVSILGYLAAKTTRVALGPGILPIYSRTPALIAQTAAGLDYVSGGRAVLGLGASGPQVIEGWHGVAYDRPIARTRELIEICRRVWRRERLQNSGLFEIPLAGGTGLGKPLKLITQPLRERIPIYLAAIGPANVSLAAELTEGWLPIFYLPEQAAMVWGDAIAKGIAQRDPSLGDFDIIAGGLLAIGDEEEALELARPQVALYVGGMGARTKNFYNDLFRRYGYGDLAEEIQELYLDGERDKAAARLPIDLLRRLNLVGDEGFVMERVRAYAASGVTTLMVSPAGQDPLGSFSRLRAMVDRL